MPHLVKLIPEVDLRKQLGNIDSCQYWLVENVDYITVNNQRYFTEHGVNRLTVLWRYMNEERTDGEIKLVHREGPQGEDFVRQILEKVITEYCGGERGRIREVLLSMDEEVKTNLRKMTSVLYDLKGFNYTPEQALLLLYMFYHLSRNISANIASIVSEVYIRPLIYFVEWPSVSELMLTSKYRPRNFRPFIAKIFFFLDIADVAYGVRGIFSLRPALSMRLRGDLAFAITQLYHISYMMKPAWTSFLSLLRNIYVRTPMWYFKTRLSIPFRGIIKCREHLDVTRRL